MKILIVDDEEQIRSGIRNFILFKQFPLDSVEMAGDGEEALERIRSSDIDILITDVVMPNMNGIQLVKKIKEQLPGKIKIVMISGHSDIDYLKAAFKFEAIDYILKPIDLEELSAILTKVVSLCERERAEADRKAILDNKLQESMPLLREKFLLRLITGQTENTSDDALRERMDFLGISMFRYSRFVAIDFFIGDLSAQTAVGRSRHEERVYGDIAACIREEMKPLHIDLFPKTARELVGIVSLPSGQDAETDDSGWKRQLTERLIPIRERLHERYEGAASIGIGNPVDSIRDLYKSYNQSLEANHQRFALGTDLILFHGDIGESPSAAAELPRHLEQDLVYCILHGGYDELRHTVEGAFRSVTHTGLSEGAFQKFKLKLVGLLANVIKNAEMNLDEKFYIDRVKWDELTMIRTPEEMELWLIDKLNSVCDYGRKIRRSKSTIIVAKAKELAAGRLREGMNVQMIADQLKISSNYLSALFKQETGIGLTDYITQARLDKAKQLIKQSTLKISEICTMVGYEDRNYFARAFKKQFGLTPTEYRSIGND